MTDTTDAPATARTVVQLMHDGRCDEAVTFFGPVLRQVVTAEALQTVWSAEARKIGDFTGIGAPSVDQAATGDLRVTLPVKGEGGAFAVVMSFDNDGLVNGLRLAPAEPTVWTVPPYADPKAFHEQNVIVGVSSSQVPGTVTLPRKTSRPAPGVVLLSGGGPFDRDETFGPNKPLKDLAWGLATRGVAVLRFDKVTYGDPNAAATMREEYLPHALAAVQALRGHSAVNPARVYIVGHSMGARVAPLAAVADPTIAGLVLLAGDSQPMHKSAVRVFKHLHATDPEAFPEAAVKLIEKQAALVASDELTPDTPSSDLLFGFSGSYWLDVRAYDPVATAGGLDTPMLVLQGARDYQVTVADDLAGWKNGLTGRQNVTFRVYDQADHHFFPGDGPSVMADLLKPQHVDVQVINDVARWLGAGRAGWGRVLAGVLSRAR